MTSRAFRLFWRHCSGQVAFLIAFPMYELFCTGSEVASLVGAFIVDFSCVMAGLAVFTYCGCPFLVSSMVKPDRLLLRGIADF